MTKRNTNPPTQTKTIQLNQKERDLLQTVVEQNTLYMGSLASIDNNPKVQEHLKTFQRIQGKLEN